MQQPVSSLENLNSTWWDTQECIAGAVDRSEALFNPFGSISRHRDAERQCRAVDRSYRILGIQQPVLSVETLTSTCWDTLEDTSRAVNRFEGLISPLRAFPHTETTLSGRPLVSHLMHAATTFEP